VGTRRWVAVCWVVVEGGEGLVVMGVGVVWVGMAVEGVE
jgi:hypothetical protein